MKPPCQVREILGGEIGRESRIFFNIFIMSTFGNKRRLFVFSYGDSNFQQLIFLNYKMLFFTGLLK